MAVNLYRVILPVSDLSRAVEFYRELFANDGRKVSPGRHYFDCSGTILACFDPRADGDAFDAEPNPGHIYFAVDDLEAAHERAKRAGAMSVDESIVQKPWGERLFYVKDPFGNPLCFVDESTVFTGE